ncbi:MAG TPA: hypothetical protein VE821_08065, partial [Pyrinomonadaceae bacterium]|nr:hypothetical protein [Pyrinomonadaceae bacterium]
YILAYGGRHSYVGEAQHRLERAKNYLINRCRVPAIQIVTIDGGYKEEATTTLWIIPAGLTPPAAMPTVDPNEIKLIVPHKQKRRLRSHS